MAHFHRINVIGNYLGVKVNLDYVTDVSLYISKDNRKHLKVNYTDGGSSDFTEGIDIENAELEFKLFPC